MSPAGFSLGASRFVACKSLRFRRASVAFGAGLRAGASGAASSGVAFLKPNISESLSILTFCSIGCEATCVGSFAGAGCASRLRGCAGAASAWAFGRFEASLATSFADGAFATFATGSTLRSSFAASAGSSEGCCALAVAGAGAAGSAAGAGAAGAAATGAGAAVRALSLREPPLQVRAPSLREPALRMQRLAQLQRSQSQPGRWREPPEASHRSQRRVRHERLETVLAPLGRLRLQRGQPRSSFACSSARLVLSAKFLRGFLGHRLLRSTLAGLRHCIGERQRVVHLVHRRLALQRLDREALLLLQAGLFELAVRVAAAQARRSARAVGGGSAAARRAALALSASWTTAVFSSTALAMSIRPSIAAMRAVSRAVQPGRRSMCSRRRRIPAR